MKTFAAVLRLWFILAVALTLVCGILYIAVQQNYRLTANDPQVAMANDAANAIDNGTDPKSLITGPQMEISNSLSPFMIIYNGQGEPVASGAVISGMIPKLPSGVFAFVNTHGEDIISWQPGSGIRMAMVIKRTRGNNLFFVAAGRSLRTTEERIAMLGKQVAFGWVCSLIILFFTVWISKLLSKKES